MNPVPFPTPTTAFGGFDVSAGRAGLAAEGER